MQRTSDIFRVLIRGTHSKAMKNNEPRIYLSKDEKCFVSYHPREEHPYECTRPLPKVQEEDKSYLKVDATNMITQAPNLEQLQQLTFTPKSHWRNYEGRRKRRTYKEYFDDKVDRKGITT